VEAGEVFGELSLGLPREHQLAELWQELPRPPSASPELCEIAAEAAEISAELSPERAKQQHQPVQPLK